jgi:lipopolysaccharide transport system ATP-binding protein
MPQSTKHQEQDTRQENEVLVRVSGVSKKFCRDLKKSLWYGMKDVASELLPIKNSKLKIQNSEDALRPGEFWANKDISFELRRGECLGLIGHNGAGKTTLLKMLNGLIKPDSGTIEMRGRVGALIALGAGFNPILTGRENIYVSGTILGLTKDEIDKQIDDIIDFAEIREFIDSPVQSYSSGMQVRLGFSVASSLSPDVLILDEVLAVGDIGFVIKCLNRVRQIANNSAVIFVSHTMQFVSSFCTKVMVLEKGRNHMLSENPRDGINCYLQKMNREASEFRANDTTIRSLQFLGLPASESNSIEIQQGQNVNVELKIFIQSASESNTIGFYIDDESQSQVVAYPLHDSVGNSMKFGNGLHTITIPIGVIDLNTGPYSFMITITDTENKTTLLRIAGYYPFLVIGDKKMWTKIVRPVTPSLQIV